MGRFIHVQKCIAVAGEGSGGLLSFLHTHIINIRVYK